MSFSDFIKPLGLPGVTSTPATGGSDVAVVDQVAGGYKVKVCGRERKVEVLGRKRVVTIKGKKVSLTEAREMDKKWKAEKKADAAKKAKKTKKSKKSKK